MTTIVAPDVDHLLHISEIVPGSPLPLRIKSISGELGMLKPCNPGDPVTFAIFTHARNMISSGSNARRSEKTSISLKFSTGSFIYPKSVSTPALSTSTVSSSPFVNMAKKFEEVMEMLKHNTGKEVTILLERPQVPHGSGELERYPSLVTSKQRGELQKRYKIEVEFSKGFSLRGKDGVWHEIYKDTPASWFASNASSVSQITHDAPPCGQAERQPLMPESSTIAVSATAESHGDLIFDTRRRLHRDGADTTTREAQPGHRWEEAHAESSTAALARGSITKRTATSMGNGSGLQSDSIIIGAGELTEPARPVKRQRLALTSSDEIYQQGNLGNGQGVVGSAGPAAGRLSAGKENAGAGTTDRITGAEVRTIKAEIPAIVERRRDSGTVASMDIWDVFHDEAPAMPSRPLPLARSVYRPRDFAELTAWADQGPLTITLPTCQLTYQTLGGMGANEKSAPAGERLPKQWNLIAVINAIDAHQHRVGSDHMINLQLSDPTRHAAGDYTKFSLFSSTVFRDFPFNAGYGSVILIRNAHPNRFQAGRLMARCAAKEPWSFAVLDRENNFHYGAGSRDPRNREGLTPEERDYMRALFEWQRVCHVGLQPAPYNEMYHGLRSADAPQALLQGHASRIQLGQRSPDRGSAVATRLPSQRTAAVECSKQVYTHHILGKVSTIAEIIACQVVPFQFRLKAPVTDTLPGSDRWDKCLIKWCKGCETSFTGKHCVPCDDTTCAHAEYRFRFWVLLGEDHEPSLPVQIWQPQMPLVFPPLPRVVAGQELSKDQLKNTKVEMLDMLLGKKNDGERPRLPIDWSIEAFWVQGEDGFRHRMFRAFDMV